MKKEPKSMSLSQIRMQLEELNLQGILSIIDETLKSLQEGTLSGTEAFDLVLQKEKQSRFLNASRARIKRSKIRKRACLEDFDISRNRAISKGQLRELASMEWCKNGQPLVLIGPTGIGKTYLARALGLRVCEEGMSTLFLSVNEYLEKEAISRSCNSYLKFRDKLTKPDLLIIDDFGMRKFSTQEAEDLRDIIEQRSYGKSTLFTTQLPFEHWGEVIADSIILDALIDRIEPQGLAIKLSGASYRKNIKKDLDFSSVPR